MRRAKIVCTLGPAVEGHFKELVQAGMDVARLNLSHGSYEEHSGRYHDVRAAAEAVGRNVGILVDLQGPKIRLGRFTDGPIQLAVGDVFTITTEDVPGDQQICSTTYKGLAGDANPGDMILVDDGKVALRVLRVEGPQVVTEVEVGGEVSNNKGLNLPGVAVSVPAMSDKDKADLRWGLEIGADLIALSFVRNAADITEVHEIMAEVGRKVPVIAKIEKPQAVDNLEEIIKAFDGIMVARGDLGVELPLEQVPMVQKRAVELSRRAAKPVIVATQVLDSMMMLPRPTRAEASDCANAVLDGADAVMLSGETSVGRFPLEAVRTMARIIETTEDQMLDRIPPLGTRPSTKGGAVTYAAATVAELLDAKYLVAFSQSGDSARRMSRLRSRIPLLAFTPDPSVRAQLAVSWGVEAFMIKETDHTDAMINEVDEALQTLGRCSKGERVVVAFGAPTGTPGTLNTMRVHKVGQVVAD